MPAGRVSVIVLNYNGAHLLPDCLESLLAQDPPCLEILVVDNASTDESMAVVRRYPKVRWEGLPTNEGLGPGYNAGAAVANGEYLFFVNNDTWFERDCARQLLKAFQGDDILAADPLQMDWAGSRVIHGAQRFRWGWRYWRRPIPGIDPYQDFTPGRQREIPWACAGAMLVDRKKFEALGGFDPTFFLDYEDMDLCWRGWLRGWKTLCIPSARLRHRVGASGEVPGVHARRTLSQVKNAQRFAFKVMPWYCALLALVRGAAQGSRGLRAGLSNCADLPEILSERRRILSESRIRTVDLLKRSWDAR